LEASLFAVLIFVEVGLACFRFVEQFSSSSIAILKKNEIFHVASNFSIVDLPPKFNFNFYRSQQREAIIDAIQFQPANSNPTILFNHR
jgi:hypothetical protein